MLVRCLPASVQSARSVFEKNTHDLRAFHSITDSTDLTDNLCLEGNTERSESNPGRSLGIKAWRGGLSGRQYLIDKLFRLRLSRRVQNLSRIKLMRRILSFHGFLLCFAGFLCACRALGLSRIISLWAVGLSARSVQRKLHPTRLRLKKHPCQSYKSVFEKKLSGETNTD